MRLGYLIGALLIVAVGCSADQEQTITPAHQSDGVVDSGGSDDEPIDFETDSETPQSEAQCAQVGRERSCYDGDPAVAGVGQCAAGVQICESNGEFLVWGPCLGSVQPTDELCDDGIDNNCDGEVDETCTCDGSPAYKDVHGDLSVRLKGSETLGLDKGPHVHAWACNEDEARINVCESTTLTLTGQFPTVIGGQGIGPIGSEPVTINIFSQSAAPIFILVDATAPVTLNVVAPFAHVTVTSKGDHPVDLSYKTDAGVISLGPGGGSFHVMGTGTPGTVSVTAAGTLPTPTASCP